MSGDGILPRIARKTREKPGGLPANVAAKALAWTKTFAMAAAAFLSVTLVPVLMLLFIRGRIPPEHKNPLVRFLYAQAYGARVLPIYPGVTDRATLLADIRRLSGVPAIPAVDAVVTGDQQ